MIRGEPIIDGQKERIYLFWDRCVARSTKIAPPPAGLLSQLSLLTCSLSDNGSYTIPCKAACEHAHGQFPGACKFLKAGKD